MNTIFFQTAPPGATGGEVLSAPPEATLETVGLALLAYGLVQLLSRVVDRLLATRASETVAAAPAAGGFRDEDRRRLETLTGRIVRGHAYPFGDYDDRVVLDCGAIVPSRRSAWRMSRGAGSTPTDAWPLSVARRPTGLAGTALTRSGSSGFSLRQRGSRTRMAASISKAIL